jgi:hypothetical protein
MQLFCLWYVWRNIQGYEMRTAIRDVAEGADMGLETGSVPGLSCSLYGGVDFGEDYREVTFDDYNFEQFIELLRSQFQDILIKPIYVQLMLEFPELYETNLQNDLDLVFYGNDEILEAKRLNNFQAKMQIGYELTSNFKGPDGEKSFLHPRLVAERILELPKDLLEL